MKALKQCTRSASTTCTDCDSRTCSYAGDREADCPKYRCDNTHPYDCKNCQFISQYLNVMRNDLRRIS